MRHLIESKRILILIGAVVLAGGCAGMIADDPVVTRGPEKSASTMTRSPADYQPEIDARRSDEARVRAAAAQQREAERFAASGGTVSGVPQRPLTRSERAVNVLRRSPLGMMGRWVSDRVVRPLAGSPARTSTNDTTPRSLGSTPHVGSPGGTAVSAGPPANPGAGRVVLGQPVDTGSGIRSSVDGTPVEPIPGVTPASSQVPVTTGSTAPSSSAGTASAASSPPRNTATTPPVGDMATQQPASGTTVTNTGASNVEVKTNPDGTPVITNEEEEDENP